MGLPILTDIGKTVALDSPPTMCGQFRPYLGVSSPGRGFISHRRHVSNDGRLQLPQPGLVDRIDCSHQRCAARQGIGLEHVPTGGSHAWSGHARCNFAQGVHKPIAVRKCCEVHGQMRGIVQILLMSSDSAQTDLPGLDFRG